jgi:AcrR family transcriptional regulator
MNAQRYDMTNRAAAAAETRRRIVEAATRVYARDGFRHATMQAVARQAGVSPSTVLNHFSTPQELMAAAVDVLRRQLRLPSRSELESLPGMEERVRKLVGELAACYERSDGWYALYLRDRAHVPVLQQASAEFFGEVDALIGVALGRAVMSERRRTIVGVLMGPANITALRATGMSTAAAADAAAEVVLGWLRSCRAADSQ